MKQDKIVPGAILILLGVVFLLQSFGALHIHWWNVFRLWPIFIVIAGINLIFVHNRSPWATALKLGVVVIGLGVLLFGNFDNSRYNWWPGSHFYYHSDDNDDDDDNDDADTASHRDIVKMEGNSTFTEPFNTNVRVARLNINGGAAVYRLSDTTNQLFYCNTKEMRTSYELDHHMESDSVYVLDFNMKKNNHVHWDNDHDNTATFKLNIAPIWDMNVATGATDLNFDLSKFKVRNLKINGGAASLKIKLGMPLETTNVSVATGISEARISVPKDAACRISDAGLVSSNFDGFTKNGDAYETPGFSSAKNKIYISMKGAISDFKVDRY